MLPSRGFSRHRFKRPPPLTHLRTAQRFAKDFFAYVRQAANLDSLLNNHTYPLATEGGSPSRPDPPSNKCLLRRPLATL